MNLLKSFKNLTICRKKGRKKINLYSTKIILTILLLGQLILKFEKLKGTCVSVN